MTDLSPALTDAPPERIELPSGAFLVRCTPDRAASSVAAINASLEHLQPWMEWAKEPATEASIGTFLAAQEELWDQRKDFGCSIVDGTTDEVIGGTGLHNRLGPGAIEIGYWVHVDWIGRGLATEASRALTDAAFELDEIDRVEIHCDEGNVRSARVPDKLGYSFQGIVVPDDGVCAGRPTQIWVMQRSDWPTTTS